MPDTVQELRISEVGLAKYNGGGQLYVTLGIKDPIVQDVFSIETVAFEQSGSNPQIKVTCSWAGTRMQVPHDATQWEPWRRTDSFSLVQTIDLSEHRSRRWDGDKLILLNNNGQEKVEFVPAGHSDILEEPAVFKRNDGGRR